MSYADNYTDEMLEELEKKIDRVYSEAQKDFEKQSKEYFEKFAKRDEEYHKLVDTGEITEKEYKQWRLNQIGRGERLDKMAAQMAQRATKANEVAVDYVNDATPSIYSLNRNHEAYVIEKLGYDMSVGGDFTLLNESSVRRLMVTDPDVMPYYPKERAIQRGIDLEYGQKYIKKHVTSGILQGKSVYKIADDLQKDLTNMERASAIRTARTAVTSAQNGGRQDTMNAARAMGIKLPKRWVAVKDSRTRDIHGKADGQTVDSDKPFIVGGEKLMFPGDPSASGWNFYNCRCGMRTVEKEGIEAEQRQVRVRNPEWEKAHEDEEKAKARYERALEKEKAETDPEKKKELRKARLEKQHEYEHYSEIRKGTQKNIVVNGDMTYEEWAKLRGVKPKKTASKSARINELKNKYKSAEDAMLFGDEQDVQDYLRLIGNQTKKLDTVESVAKSSTDKLAGAYEHHRISNNLRSVAYDELPDNFVYAEYKNLSIESAREFDDTIGKLVDEYDTPLMKIRTMSKEEAMFNNSFASVTHNYTTDTAEMLINPVKCKDYDKMTERIKELSNKGYCVKIADDSAGQYIATHEFAHGIINIKEPLSNKTNFVNADYAKIKKARKEINEVYDDYIKNVGKAKSELDKYETEALLTGDETAWKKAQEASKAYNNVKISNYSLTNVDEFLAESFANEKIGINSNEYSRRAVAVLDKYFKR